MQLKGSKTETLLKQALQAELEASFRYRQIAVAARAAGLPHVAELFEATAANELDHAGHEYGFLYGATDVGAAIDRAVANETREAETLYPQAADTAEAEGFAEIADFFRRVAAVEDRHREHFTGLAEATAAEDRAHTVGYSTVAMARVMQPEQANPAGFVHGGEMMKFMDDAAAVVAARHSGTSVVTGSVEDISFLRPVRIGDLVTVKGRLTYAGATSMEVKIEVEAEGMFGAEAPGRHAVLSALFVMVAVDGKGRPVRTRPLIPMTEEEMTLYEEGRSRHESRKKK
jgi:acyl-CoA hydrolase